MSELERQPTDSLPAEAEGYKNGLRIVPRNIVSIYIWSNDGFLLMGKKDPSKGGTYPGVLRIPGGGLEPGEEPVETAIREGGEEVLGLDLTQHPLTELPITARGEHQKTLENGETVWQKMKFIHFEARLNKPAAQLKFRPGDDLVELFWIPEEELPYITQMPEGPQLMIEAGYIDPLLMRTSS